MLLSGNVTSGSQSDKTKALLSGDINLIQNAFNGAIGYNRGGIIGVDEKNEIIYTGTPYDNSSSSFAIRKYNFNLVEQGSSFSIGGTVRLQRYGTYNQQENTFWHFLNNGNLSLVNLSTNSIDTTITGVLDDVATVVSETFTPQTFYTSALYEENGFVYFLSSNTGRNFKGIFKVEISSGTVSLVVNLEVELGTTLLFNLGISIIGSDVYVSYTGDGTNAYFKFNKETLSVTKYNTSTFLFTKITEVGNVLAKGYGYNLTNNKVNFFTYNHTTNSLISTIESESILTNAPLNILENSTNKDVYAIINQSISSFRIKQSNKSIALL